MAEERRFLFEIDIDAAKKNRRAGALIFLIERQRQIEWQHQNLMTHAAQFGDERVVAETISAIHRAGAGCDLDDVHTEVLATD